MIIPFFIPFSGCPHQCVFCNQKTITGQPQPIDSSSLPRTITEYLETVPQGNPPQVAFYGGTFTALPHATQIRYLETVQPFIKSGQIANVRLSTRPDCINLETLALLKDYNVALVELGAQSLDDHVLAQSGRGHIAADTTNAVKLLKANGFTVGLQLMAGLPGDTTETFNNTIAEVLALMPDVVRLYPLLVIKGTPLESRYHEGTYTPLSLDDAVLLCRDALKKFVQAGIEVIRIGLQPTEELESPGSILAGPYHPAFRQLVESALFLDKMRTALHERREKKLSAVFLVHPADISSAIGQKRSNIVLLKKEFGLQAVSVAGAEHISTRRELVLVQ